MSLDWNTLFTQICGTALERDLCEMLFRGTPPGEERDRLKSYIAGLASKASVPNNGPPADSPESAMNPPAIGPSTPTKSQPRWGWRWGTRIAIWCAVLSVICVYATAYFNLSNLQSIEENGRPIDLW